MPIIRSIRGREILDSRGNPTVEAEIELACGIRGHAAVPSGASTGRREALELRDGDSGRYNGLGVRKAVENINGPIAKALTGMAVLDQQGIDSMLCGLDGTPEKKHLGANAILAVSVAALRTAAGYLHLPLYRYIGGLNAVRLPCPMVNVINAGAHSCAPVDFQEFMICPAGIPSYPEALRACAEIFHALKDVLIRHGYGTSVGDEGGYTPSARTPNEIFDLIGEAVELAGYHTGRHGEGEMTFALDCAASEFYDPGTKLYVYHKSGGNLRLDSAEQAAHLEELVRQYPIDSIEDGMAEDDWDGWQMLYDRIGSSVHLVGDDLLVTNIRYLKQAVKLNAANAILVKMNQVGTVTETLESVSMARGAGWQVIISHRSGETGDTTIADLAVGCCADRIKTGSICRGERIVKYNRLLRIAAELEK